MPGTFDHIVNHGNEQRKIFLDDEDRRSYKELVHDD
jgi:hypothetical protein